MRAIKSWEISDLLQFDEFNLEHPTLSSRLIEFIDQIKGRPERSEDLFTFQNWTVHVYVATTFARFTYFVKRKAPCGGLLIEKTLTYFRGYLSAQFLPLCQAKFLSSQNIPSSDVTEIRTTLAPSKNSRVMLIRYRNVRIVVTLDNPNVKEYINEAFDYLNDVPSVLVQLLREDGAKHLERASMPRLTQFPLYVDRLETAAFCFLQFRDNDEALIDAINSVFKVWYNYQVVLFAALAATKPTFRKLRPRHFQLFSPSIYWSVIFESLSELAHSVLHNRW